MHFVRVLIAVGLPAMSALVSAQFPPGLDPVKNMCLRMYQQSTIKNDFLYIDGGLQTFVTANNNSNFKGKIIPGYNNYLIAVDMRESWDWKVNISETALQKTENLLSGTLPPVVISGALYSGGPGDNNIYLYGGTVNNWNTTFDGFQSATSPQYGLWSFDTVKKTWGQYDITNTSPQRPSGGYWTDAPNLGLAFYIGGIIDKGSSLHLQWLSDRTEFGLLGMVVIDTKTQTARNVSTTPLTRNNPRSRGSLVYVDRFGDNGILVSLGGSYRSLTDTSDEVIGTMIPFDTIEVFDVASLDSDSSGKWYQQKTSGNVPGPRIDACAVTATAPDNSSTNIYIYGGRNETAIFDEIFALSLPSFTWTKIFEGQSPRYGMTCHLAGKRQLITVGGWSSTNLVAGCDWEDKGVGVYDLSTLIWGSVFNAHADDYLVPTPVLSQIGGNVNGSATMTYPLAGYTNPTFGHLFNKAIATILASSNPTSTSSSPPSSHPPSKGAVAGGVIGGIAFLSLLLGLFIFLRRRRAASTHLGNPAELAGSYYTSVVEKDATVPHVELAARTGNYAELPADRGVEIMGTTHVPKDSKEKNNVEREGEGSDGRDRERKGAG